MERVAQVVDEYCSFPVVEKEKLFRRTVVAFLTGNEDMHVKNFSLITDNNVVRLSPAYDFVNSTIVLSRAREELALPLVGKKSNLRRDDLTDYFGRERLRLAKTVLDYALDQIADSIPEWRALIEASFLSAGTKSKYSALLDRRVSVMFGRIQ